MNYPSLAVTLDELTLAVTFILGELKLAVSHPWWIPWMNSHLRQSPLMHSHLLLQSPSMNSLWRSQSPLMNWNLPSVTLEYPGWTHTCVGHPWCTHTCCCSHHRWTHSGVHSHPWWTETCHHSPLMNTLDERTLAVSHHWQIHLLSVTLDEYPGWMRMCSSHPWWTHTCSQSPSTKSQLPSVTLDELTLAVNYPWWTHTCCQSPLMNSHLLSITLMNSHFPSVTHTCCQLPLMNSHSLSVTLDELIPTVSHPWWTTHICCLSPLMNSHPLSVTLDELAVSHLWWTNHGVCLCLSLFRRRPHPHQDCDDVQDWRTDSLHQETQHLHWL